MGTPGDRRPGTFENPKMVGTTPALPPVGKIDYRQKMKQCSKQRLRRLTEEGRMGANATGAKPEIVTSLGNKNALAYREQMSCHELRNPPSIPADALFSYQLGNISSLLIVCTD